MKHKVSSTLSYQKKRDLIELYKLNGKKDQKLGKIIKAVDFSVGV